MSLILFDLDETLVANFQGKIANFDDVEDELEFACKVVNLNNLYPSEENANFGRIEYVLPGVMEMLNTLIQQGHTLGIITSRKHSDDYFTGNLSRLNSYFGIILGTTDTPNHAATSPPKTKLIIEAMNKLGRNSEETIYVGDLQTDLQAAHAAEVNFIEAAYYSKNSFRSCALAESLDNVSFCTAYSPQEILTILSLPNLQQLPIHNSR